MLQNPVYAGFTKHGLKTPEQRLHEPYISVEDYNLLNNGFRSIIIGTGPRKPSYISRVRCVCKEGSLNKNADRFRCPKCKRSGKEEDLFKAITRCLANYRYSKEDGLMTSVLRRLKMWRLQFIFEEIHSSLMNRKISRTMLIDKEALPYTAFSYEDIKKSNEVLSAFAAYHEKGFGELAVLWVEAYNAGEQLDFIMHMQLDLVYDADEKVAELKKPIPNMDTSKNSPSLEEVNQLVEERNNQRHTILKYIRDNPWLMAVMRHDLGFASGDFWTDFEDQLKD